MSNHPSYPVEAFFQKLVFPFLVALFLSLVVTFPAITQLNSSFIGDGGDSYQYAGFQTLVAENLRQGKWPYASSNLWYYPEGFQFSRGYDSVLSTLGGGLLLLLVNQPVLVYNLTILGAFIFNFLGAYLFFEYLSKNSWLGVLGATIFGFSFYALARGAGHANLLLVGGFPLFAYAVMKLKKSQSRNSFFLLGISMIFIALSSAQYVALLAIALGVISPIALLFYTRDTIAFFQKLWAQKTRLLVTGIGVFLIISPFLMPLFSAYLKKDYVGRDTRADFSPRAIDFVVANPFLPVLSSSMSPVLNQEKSIEHVVFLGWVEIFLLVILLFTLFGEKKILFSGIGVLVFVLFSLGVKNPETGVVLPYAWLYTHFPFSVVPEPGRYMIVVYFFLASFLVLALKKVLPSTSQGSRYLLFLIFAGLVLERISWGGYFLSPAPTGDFVKSVQSSSGEAVLDIPLLSNQQANILPAFYAKSVISGQAHWLGNTDQTTSFVSRSGLAKFVCSPDSYFPEKQLGSFGLNIPLQQVIQNLSREDISTVVVHRDQKLYWPECKDVLSQVSQAFPRIMTAQESVGNDSESHIRWSGTTMRTGLFFPKKGVLKLYGMEYAPAREGELNVLLNGQPLESANWTRKVFPREIEGFTQNIQVPEQEVTFIPIVPGSLLEITSELVPVEQGFFTIWYSYEIDPSSLEEKNFLFGNFERLYFDTDKEVYQVF